MLCQVPFTILENIALELALVDERGPPTHLISLLCTCTHIHASLSFATNKYLYARIFRARFDTAAVRRRHGLAYCRTRNLAEQLKVYCNALRRIRGGDITADTVLADMWAAFFMVVENDGLNEQQLEWAGLKDFVDRFVRTRLHEGKEIVHNWPHEITINSLALWLMWFTTDEDTLTQETADARRQLMELVRPYVVMPIRYPTFHVPDYVFSFPVRVPVANALSLGLTQTPHGYYPPYRPTSTVRTELHHYHARLHIARPPLALAARLLYFARSEATPFHIPPALPRDREEALARGITQPMPTQADYMRFNEHKAASVFPKGKNADSSRWDEDLARMVFCADPFYVSPSKTRVYRLGQIEGDWMGRMLLPDSTQYFTIAQTQAFVPHQPLMTTVPISLRLREFHSISPAPVAAIGGPPGSATDDGPGNAWFPTGYEFKEARGKVRVLDRLANAVAAYERYVPGQPNAHAPSTCRMCVERRREAELERAREAWRREKKRKSVGDTDDEEEDADMDVDDEGGDAEGRVRGKRARRSRSIEGEGGDGADGGEAEPEDASGMERGGAGRQDLQQPFDHVQVEKILDVELGPLAMRSDDGECNGIQDMIIVGETLPKHGQAWHHYRFYGRVRMYDGLIALVRVPVHIPELGTTVFRGYITGDQHFVGNWRTVTFNRNLIPLEGPFIASRASNAE